MKKKFIAVMLISLIVLTGVFAGSLAKNNYIGLESGVFQNNVAKTEPILINIGLSHGVPVGIVGTNYFGDFGISYFADYDIPLSQEFKIPEEIKTTKAGLGILFKMKHDFNKVVRMSIGTGLSVGFEAVKDTDVKTLTLGPMFNGELTFNIANTVGLGIGLNTKVDVYSKRLDKTIVNPNKNTLGITNEAYISLSYMY